MGKKSVHGLFVGKPEGKIPLGRPRHRWIDKIKMDLSEIVLSVVDCIGLAQDRYKWKAHMNAVMNLWAPYNPGKISSGCTTFGLSSGTQFHSYLIR
jgi:hypothetical protein